MKAGEEFEQRMRKALDRPEGKGCVLWLGIIVLLGIVVFASVIPYTNYLWYAHDIRQPQVFSLAYKTRGTLFAISFVLAVGLFWFSLSRALAVSTVYLRMPETLGEVLVSAALN